MKDKIYKSRDLNDTAATAVLCTGEAATAVANSIFLDLVQETNMNAVLDGKQEQVNIRLLAPFDKFITSLSSSVMVNDT